MPRKVIRGDLLVTGAITPALGVEYADNVFIIDSAAGATKQMRFSAAGVTAGQKRVLTSPDYNGTLATLDGTETFTAKTLTSPKVGTAICDTAGCEIIKTPATPSAVNEITVTNAATGGSPSIAATGDNTNIGLTVAAKGTGAVMLGQATSTGVNMAADQPLCDSAGNEYLKFAKTTTAVNEFTVTNAAAGGSPLLSATGGDTNISIKLAAKGTGIVVSAVRVAQLQTVTTNATASDQTYTAAGLLGGIILRNCSGGSRADLLPAAVDLVAAIPGCAVGTGFEFTIRNTSTAAETITVTVNTGVTISGTATIAQNNTKRFLVVVTNVTGSAEAYTIYSLGTVVH